MKKTLKISLILFFGVLLLAEIILRIFFQGPLDVVRVIRPLPYQPDPVINYIYIPNTTYLHGQSGVEFSLNNEGFIGKDIPPKDSTKYRIIFVGDSMVASDLKNPYHSAFPDELEKIIEEKGDKIEVFNCAIDGMTKLAYHRIIEYKVKNYQPDLILSLYGLPFQDDERCREQYRGFRLAYVNGDYRDRDALKSIVDNYCTRYEKWLHRAYKLHLFKAFLKLQIKYRFLPAHIKPYMDLFLLGQISTKKISEVDFSLDESIRMVLETKKVLAEKGIGFFLFAVGSDVKDMYHICAENRVPFIPVTVDLEPEDYFPHDHHFNRSGNEKIAQKLYTTLTRRIIPGHYLAPSRE